MKGRGLDRVPTLIETHSLSTPNGFQASQNDPSIGLLHDAECLPGTNTTEHNPTFRIDDPNGHGGNVPTRRGICQPATSTARGARRCGRRRPWLPRAALRGNRPAPKSLQKNRVQGLTWFCCRSGGPWCASKAANGLRPPHGRPRAAAGAMARPTGAAGAGLKTCVNVLSHNQ